MAVAVVGELGEVEQKLVALVELVFQRQVNQRQLDDEGNECITKEQCKEFVREVMEDAGEADAWDEDEFEECY
jgi:hypothetical protein